MDIYVLITIANNTTRNKEKVEKPLRIENTKGDNCESTCTENPIRIQRLNVLSAAAVVLPVLDDNFSQ